MNGHRRGRRYAAWLTFLLLFGAGVAGCSGEATPERTQAEEILQLGLEAHADGDLHAAEAAYLGVIRLDPQNKFAYYNLGVISQARGDVERALEHYGTTLRIDPDFVPALFNLAILRAEASEIEEAVRLYEHVIEIDPSHAAAHLNLGFLLLEQGKDRRAGRELEEAVRLDPSLKDRIRPETSADPVASASPSR